MITWMQTALQKHLKTIFILLLAIIIISFVFTIGAAPGIRGVENEVPEIKFYGVNLTSERELRPYQEAAMLSSILDFGVPPHSEQQMTIMLLSRIYLLHVADQLEIPHPNTEVVGEFIKTKRVFHDNKGGFNVEIYNNFLEYLDKNPKSGRVVLAKTLDQDYRINQVRSILAGPGYVQHEEAVIMLQAYDTEWNVILASMDLTQFKPEVKATQEQLKEYFEHNKDHYTVEAKVTAELISFAAKDFLHKVEVPSDADVKAYFEMHQATYATKGVPSPTFESVAEKVKQDYMLSKAKEYAAEEGNQFAVKLFENKIQHPSEDFNKLYKESGAKSTKVGPYGVSDLQKLSSTIPVEGLMLAFNLTKENYFSDVFLTKDGAALLLIDEKMEPREPKFEEVVNAVRQDYNDNERNQLLADHVKSIEEQLKTASKTAAEFDAKAKELKLTVQLFEKLSLKETSDKFPQPLFVYLNKLHGNEVSPFVKLGNTGYILFLKDRVVPSQEDVKGELEKSMASFRAMAGNMELQGYLSEAMMKLQPKK